MRWLVLVAIYGLSLARLARAGRRNELIVSCIVIGLLAVFLAVAAAMRASSTGRDIRTRTETWSWMVAAFLLAASTRVELMFVMLGFLSFVALREYFSLLPMYRGTFLRHEDRLAIGVAYLTIPITYVLAWLPWYGLYIILIPVYAMLLLPVALLAGGHPRGIIVSMGSIVVGMLLFVFLFSHAAILVWYSPFLLFYALLITELRDVFAYCVGNAFRRIPAPWLHVRVAPQVNPRKTWAAAVVAAFGCALVSWSLAPLMPALTEGTPTPRFLLWLGLAVGWLGLLGDLATGAIKRDLQVKDTSRSLPGHGGVIDRINGVVFTVPIIFHLIRYFYGGWELR
jgi:phosphatidate cytidylyltransferase